MKKKKREKKRNVDGKELEDGEGDAKNCDLSKESNLKNIVNETFKDTAIKETSAKSDLTKNLDIKTDKNATGDVENETINVEKKSKTLEIKSVPIKETAESKKKGKGDKDSKNEAAETSKLFSVSHCSFGKFCCPIKGVLFLADAIIFAGVPSFDVNCKTIGFNITLPFFEMSELAFCPISESQYALFIAPQDVSSKKIRNALSLNAKMFDSSKADKYKRFVIIVSEAFESDAVLDTLASCGRVADFDADEAKDIIEILRKKNSSSSNGETAFCTRSELFIKQAKHIEPEAVLAKNEKSKKKLKAKEKSVSKSDSKSDSKSGSKSDLLENSFEEKKSELKAASVASEKSLSEREEEELRLDCAYVSQIAQRKTGTGTACDLGIKTSPTTFQIPFSIDEGAVWNDGLDDDWADCRDNWDNVILTNAQEVESSVKKTKSSPKSNSKNSKESIKESKKDSMKETGNEVKNEVKNESKNEVVQDVPKAKSKNNRKIQEVEVRESVVGKSNIECAKNKAKETLKNQKAKEAAKVSKESGKEFKKASNKDVKVHKEGKESQMINKKKEFQGKKESQKESKKESKKGDRKEKHFVNRKKVDDGVRAANVARSMELGIAANARACQDKFGEAIELFSQAIDLNDSDYRFYVNRSYCYESVALYEVGLVNLFI